MMPQARLCGIALGAGRVAIGVVALVRPDLMARAWVGAVQAAGPAGVVLGRAAGGRDIALGVGALLASSRRNGRGLLGWTVAGSFCDAVDVAATVASWRELPPRGRCAVAGAASSGALLGALTVVLARRG
ncbi:MAG: hypothetical protein QOH09_3931 [Pseudonocardiales bacterium]|jgi:hypothetical protein|nr:hypothetical protein [Pseudonocardiales bacterium]MDT7717939.1 hypothetical protein [Pseudonocardiales bacterium]